MQNENSNENEIDIENIEQITYVGTETNTTNPVTLETIHTDLGFICSFLVIAAVLIFMSILYKLFKIFF